MTTPARSGSTSDLPVAATSDASNASRPFHIVGGGLAGALMATLLAQRGDRVNVYEKRPDPRVSGYLGGRSINLALSTRGLWGLQQAGLDGEILKLAVPMNGRMIHERDGRTVFVPYGLDASQAINSVPRGDLNLQLLNAAERAGATLHFDHTLVDLEVNAPRAVFTLPDGTRRDVDDGGAFIGADGAFSAVRNYMQRLDRFDFSQSYLEHGYKELHIPPNDNGTHRLPPNALHIWPRGELMTIALPNLDGSFTVTLFWPFTGPRSFEALKTDDDVRRFFAEVFPDAVPHLPTLVEDYRRNPTSSLVTMRCKPWYVEDKVVLIGDAAHAVVPFYGQGINCGFEDCGLLMEAMEAHPTDLAAAFRTYGDGRKPNADALADLCIYNFLEMRSKTASPLFRIQQRLDKALARIMPKRWQPLYTMVTFTRLPYAEAKRRWQSQRHTLQAAFQIALVLGLALIATILFMLAIGSGAFGMTPPNARHDSDRPEISSDAAAVPAAPAVVEILQSP